MACWERSSPLEVVEQHRKAVRGNSYSQDSWASSQEADRKEEQYRDCSLLAFLGLVAGSTAAAEVVGLV